MIKDSIGDVERNKYFFKNSFGISDLESVDLTVKRSGPALNIKINVKEEEKYQCCGYPIDTTSVVAFITVLLFIGMVAIPSILLYSRGLLYSFVFFVAFFIICMYCFKCRSKRKAVPGRRRKKNIKYNRITGELTYIAEQKKFFDADFTLALHCPEFPEIAKQSNLFCTLADFFEFFSVG